MRYTIVFQMLESMTIADKRHIFALMRATTNVESAHDAFLPQYGITFGEFALFHMLGESHRRNHANRVTEGLAD